MDLVDLVEARALGGHRVWLRFEDGLAGEIDLRRRLRGPVFRPLLDAEYFADFHLDLGTLNWPNGADFAPETLHEWVEAAQRAKQRRGVPAVAGTRPPRRPAKS